MSVDIIIEITEALLVVLYGALILYRRVRLGEPVAESRLQSAVGVLAFTAFDIFILWGTHHQNAPHRFAAWLLMLGSTIWSMCYAIDFVIPISSGPRIQKPPKRERPSLPGLFLLMAALIYFGFDSFGSHGSTSAILLYFAIRFDEIVAQIKDTFQRNRRVMSTDSPMP